MIGRTALLLVVLSSAVACAQNYVPITAVGSRWLYLHVSPWGDESWQPIDVGPDTLIAGETYQLQQGFAWRDVDGKVWCRPLSDTYPFTSDSVPLLMYDFTLQVGDTFHLPLDTAAWFVVSERDSVQLLNGTYRDRITFANWIEGGVGCSTDTWIEGVGDPGFVFSPIVDCFELGMNFECYGINNQPLFGSCSYLSQPEETVLNSYELVPSGAYGAFSLTGPVEKIQGMSVHDAVGREIVSSVMLGGGIDLSQHVASIYFLRITSSTGIQTIRFCLSPQ